MTLFKNKYRVESHRMPGWDYSGNGIYFITIVVQNRRCLFGEIINNEMKLNNFGIIVNDEWIKSAQIRRELFIDEFIVMPNHLHGIVIIKNMAGQSMELSRSLVETHCRASLCTVNSHRAEKNKSGQSKLYRKPKSISSFIAGYKSAVTTKCNNILENQNKPVFDRYKRLWQKNYHDHIIRNEKEYWRIKNYILNNPQNWDEDKFYTDT